MRSQASFDLPSFLCLSFEALTTVLLSTEYTEKLLPEFWQRLCVMRGNLVLILNRILLPVSRRVHKEQRHCGGGME